MAAPQPQGNPPKGGNSTRASGPGLSVSNSQLSSQGQDSPPSLEGLTGATPVTASGPGLSGSSTHGSSHQGQPTSSGPGLSSQTPSTAVQQGDISMTGIEVPVPAGQQKSKPKAHGIQYIRDLIARTKLAESNLAAERKGRPAPPSDSPQDPKRTQGESVHEEAMSDAPPAPATSEAEADTSGMKPFPFHEVKDFKRQACAVSVAGKPVVGFASYNEYWTPMVKLDAGKLGQPRLTIICEIQDDKKNSNQVTFTWYPSIMTEPGKFSMERLHVVSVTDYPDNKSVQNQTVIRNFPPKEIDKLIMVTFQGRAPVIDGYSEKAWTKASQDVKNFLKDLGRQEPQNITFWYKCPHSLLPAYGQQCIRPFMTWFKERRPPLCQYYNSKRELVLDLYASPDAKSVGGGMYQIWPMKKVGKERVPDKSKEPTINHLPTVEYWSSKDECQIYSALGPIRESQYTRGLTVHVGKTPCRIYTVSMPKLSLGQSSVSYKELTEEQKTFEDCMTVYVRLPGDSKDRESVISEKSRLILELDNAIPEAGKPHESIKGHQFWGSVCAHNTAHLKAVGADFSCIVRRPPGLPMPALNKGLQNLPSRLLRKAHVHIQYDPTSSVREQFAVHDFFESKKPEIVRIRDALWKKDVGLLGGDVDVTQGPKGKELPSNRTRYDDFVKQAAKEKKVNLKQLDSLKMSEDVPGGIGITVGPGGTGKTRTLVNRVWALHAAGHKQLVVCGANSAVDTDCNAIYNARPDSLKDVKILRYETGTMNAAAIVSQDTEKFETANVADLAPQREKRTFEDHPAYISAELSVLSDANAPLELLEKLDREATTFQESYDQVQSLMHRNSANIPLETTLNWHVNRLTQQDIREQQALDDEEKRKNPLIEIDSPASERCRSAKYLELLNIFVAHEGKLRKGKKEEFWKERAEIEQRVAKEVDIVLATCNNTGSNINQAGFDPTILHLDEAAQISIASFTVPLTSFDNWMAIFLYGDPEQLQAMLASGRVNEVATNCRMSAMGLFLKKGHHRVLLVLQYRMTPAISSFPNEFFYNGLLQDAQEVKVDNKTKEIMRSVSQELYQIKGPGGKGSEYWMVDVALGQARAEENGWSMLNYANADAVKECFDLLIAAGIDESSIHILSVYRGQRECHISKLRQGPNSENQLYKWSTVDAFHSKEGDVMLIDFVAANKTGVHYKSTPQVRGDEGVDPSSDLYSYGSVTAHVTNPRRICVLLTRAMSGQVIFCQTSALAKSFKESKGSKKNAAALMVIDAHDRGLLYQDRRHLDSHPDAIKERNNLVNKEAQIAKERAEAAQLSWIGKLVVDSRKVRKEPTCKEASFYGYTWPSKVPEAAPIATGSVFTGVVPSFAFNFEGAFKTQPSSQREAKNARAAAAMSKKEADALLAEGPGQRMYWDQETTASAMSWEKAGENAGEKKDEVMEEAGGEEGEIKE